MMGTGAFNFANVERGMNVNIADDSNAFLALTATSPYADGSGNELSVELSGDAGVSGDGINQDSDYSFRSVFEIENQGAQSVGVWINDNDSNDAAQWYAGNDFSQSIEGPGSAFSLASGESTAVSLVVLTRSNSAADLPDEINVVADASQG